MRAVLQRVSTAKVVVDGGTVGEIGAGLLVLLGVAPTDTEKEAQWLADKVANLRLFPDERHPINRSVLDVTGSCLVVSQFTLYGDARKGRRPSFVDAARPELAEPLYRRFCDLLLAAGVTRVERGVFGAHMDVSLTNDGPVTLLLDTPS